MCEGQRRIQRSPASVIRSDRQLTDPIVWRTLVCMTDEAAGRLLGPFVSAVQPVLPLVSVWAHGSLAGGDYQPGRSDLDLIAILGRPCTAADEQQLGDVHESLGSAIALASRLHCSYCAAGELAAGPAVVG